MADRPLCARRTCPCDCPDPNDPTLAGFCCKDCHTGDFLCGSRLHVYVPPQQQHQQFQQQPPPPPIEQPPPQQQYYQQQQQPQLVPCTRPECLCLCQGEGAYCCTSCLHGTPCPQGVSHSGPSIHPTPSMPAGPTIMPATRGGRSTTPQSPSAVTTSSPTTTDANGQQHFAVGKTYPAPLPADMSSYMNPYVDKQTQSAQFAAVQATVNTNTTATAMLSVHPQQRKKYPGDGLYFKKDEAELQPTSGVEKCPGCGAGFGTFRWRYNCYSCGHVFCDDCAPNMQVQEKLETRVCDRCALDKMGVDRRADKQRNKAAAAAASSSSKNQQQQFSGGAPAPCATRGCPCDSYNGLQGEFCSRQCRQQGYGCTTRQHVFVPQSPTSPQNNNNNSSAGQRGNNTNQLPPTAQVDHMMTASHGNSAHPMANHPTKHIDDYLLNVVVPRCKRGEPELLEKLTEAIYYAFNEKQVPPALDTIAQYFKNVPKPTFRGSYVDLVLPRINVVDEDCLVQCQKLVMAANRDGKPLFRNVAVLNPANEANCGGGFTITTGAAEEYLFRCSTLSLNLWKRRSHGQDGFRPWPVGAQMVGPPCADPEQVFYPFTKYGIIYSKRVEVFALNDVVLPPNERFNISALTMAAQDLRPPKNSYGPPPVFDRELNLRKFRALFYTAAKSGCDALVLGAIGCGVFRCDPLEIAGCFRQALDELCGSFATPETFPFKRIDFAIIKSASNIQAFQQVLLTP